MTFLNPAVLFGLLATSIPIILHFFNLRKLKTIEFSTLIFLKELQKSKIRKIKIKQWLLLILRILIITFLVLAFARPTIKNSFFISKAAKTSAVFIIDNTFSMSIVSGSGSYFNKCKQIAKNLINNFNPGDEITILPLVNTENEKIIPSTNFDFLRNKIETIQIFYQTNTLHNAILKASQILKTSKNLNKEIYVLTDLQKERIYNTQKELMNLSYILKDINLYLIDVHDKESFNLGVEEFKVNNQIFEKNKTINFSATARNYSDNSISNRVISLFINGKRSAQHSLSLEPNESRVIQFETTLNDTGLVIANVELEDDDIIFDNKSYTAFFVPHIIKVLILSDNNEDGKYIKIALSNQNGQLFQLTEKDLSGISSIRLDEFNVIIIIGSDKISDKEKIRRFIENGGTIVLFPGSKSTLNSLQNFTKYLGISVPVEFSGKLNSTETFTMFSKIDLEHPLFENLFHEKDKLKINSPEIYFHVKTYPSTISKNIITLYDNSLFLSEYKLGNGKILLFSVSPVLSWSNFPFKPIFAPLINKIIFYSSSYPKQQEYKYAGDELNVNLQNLSSKTIKVVYPLDSDNNKQSEELINIDSLINKNFLNYNKTYNAGIYKFYADNKLIDYFYVNHNPKESVVQYETVDNFKDYLKRINFNGNYTNLEPNKDYIRKINESRFGTELWKYFLLIALILTIIEMFLSKNSKKDITEK